MTDTLTSIDLEVTPLSGSIGAAIRGVDLRDVDDETIAEIRRIWLHRKVVFFPASISTRRTTKRLPLVSAT